MRVWKSLAILGLIALGVGLPAVAQPLAGVKILGWVKYADIGEEWKNTKNILKEAGAVVTETTTLSADELSALLKAVDVLLIPEQEDGWEGEDLIPAGKKLGPAFLEFLRGGGRIVSLDFSDGGVDLLRGAGLTTANDDRSVSGEDLHVVRPEDNVVNGVPLTFKALSGTTDYDTVDKDAEVIVVSKAGKPVVFRLRRHDGEILFLGFDFFKSNDAMKKVLINACAPLQPCGMPLDPGVPSRGTLAAKASWMGLCSEQYYLDVPAETGHVLIQLDGGLHLHLRAGRFVDERGVADLSLISPGPKLALVMAQLFAPRRWYFALDNPGDDDQGYTMVAWLIPTLTEIAKTPFTDRAEVKLPAIDALDTFLRTEEGYLGLVQYKVAVVKTPGMLMLALRSEKGIRGWVRYGEAVEVTGGRVVADLAFRDTFILTGPWLKSGTYYIAIEGLNPPQEYELTVELR